MRGDVVIVDFPFSDAGGSKTRPALVIQGDGIVSWNLIIAQITSNTTRPSPTRLQVDPFSPGGAGSGLKSASVVNCEMIFTIHRRLLKRTIGRLPPARCIRPTSASKRA